MILISAWSLFEYNQSTLTTLVQLLLYMTFLQMKLCDRLLKTKGNNVQDYQWTQQTLADVRKIERHCQCKCLTFLNHQVIYSGWYGGTVSIKANIGFYEHCMVLMWDMPHPQFISHCMF